MPSIKVRRRRRRETLLRRIGFFHYGSDHKHDPIGSLREALLTAIAASDGQNIRDCLIALPEAFNVRGGYWNPDRHLNRSIRTSLTAISEEFGSAFVVGLIEQSALLDSPYSSAYLIDGLSCKLLSRKTGDDRSCNYQPCMQSYDQPLAYRGICVAALICMDADFKKNRVSDRHEALLARMAAMHAGHPVLFVPAHMMTFSSEAIASVWPEHVVTVVANSAPSQPSAIRLREELIRTRPDENMQNVIYLTLIR